MNRRVVDTQEFAITGVAFRRMSGRGGAELEKGSEAGSNRHGHAIRVVDGNAFQVFTLAEPIHQALQVFVRQLAIKLRLDVLLQALSENFGAAREVVAQNAAFRAHLVGSEQKRNHNDADDERRNEFEGRAHRYFPLGKSEDFVSRFARVKRIRGTPKAPLSR